MAERLFQVIGRDDLNSNPDFRTNADRVRRRAEVDAIVGHWIAQRTLKENCAFFDEHGVTAGPVYDIAQFMADPHVQERGVIVTTQDAELGDVPMHDVVPRLSATPGSLRTPAPAIGQHNDEVYGRIGYAADRLAALRADGTI